MKTVSGILKIKGYVAIVGEFDLESLNRESLGVRFLEIKSPIVLKNRLLYQTRFVNVSEIIDVENISKEEMFNILNIDVASTPQVDKVVRGNTNVRPYLW